MKKLTLILVVCFMSASASWFIHYSCTKKISLVRMESYSEWLEWGGCRLDSGILRPLSENEALKKKLPVEGEYFVVRGKIATRFIPWEFHSVYADIAMQEADKAVVYIHRYNKRFRTTVYMP